MTRVTACAVGAAWALFATTAAVAQPCLETRGSFVQGDTHEIEFTAHGRSAYDRHVAALPVAPATNAVVPVARISDGTRVLHARFSSSQTTLKTNLGIGTYSVQLAAAEFRWPSGPTSFTDVGACSPVGLTVRERSPGEWSPNPQVFLEGPNGFALGAEAYAGRWGLAAVVAPRWDHLRDAPNSRFEIRRTATRGYLAAGVRVTQRDRARASLTLGGGLELPPFRRLPLWVLADVHASDWAGEWDGWKWRTVRSQWRAAGTVLESVSVRLRVDLRPVWR